MFRFLKEKYKLIKGINKELKSLDNSECCDDDISQLSIEQLKKYGNEKLIKEPGRGSDSSSQNLIDCTKQYETELNSERAKEIIEKLNQIPNSHCVPTKAMKKELNDLYEKITNKGEQYV